MPLETVSRSLHVRSGQGDYDARSFPAGTEFAQFVKSLADPFVLADRTIVQFYPALFSEIPKGRLYAIRATENEKTLSGVERVGLFLQRGAASKNSELVVVGGGIAQDIGMFAAHIYYRGIPAYFLPTTLLSMADSCIGAKCGLNLGKFKNQVGFFRSPREVLIWEGFLETLPFDDVRSGFGEVVKLAIISGPDSFDLLESRMEEKGFDLGWVQQAIFSSLETKRKVIEADEYEANVRKILNYGHTFGHALESITGHQVPHGLGVAWGVDLANYVALRKGYLSKEEFERIHRLLKKHFAFSVKAPYSSDDILSVMTRDKKAVGKSVTLVLPSGLGKVGLVKTDLDSSLGALVADYIDSENIFR